MKYQIKVFTSSVPSDVEIDVNEFLASDFTDNPEYVKLHVTESDRTYSVTVQYLAKND